MKIKSVTPQSNRIITTANRYHEKDFDGTIILKTDGALKEYQTVVAVSPMVDRQGNIKVGDVVMIDPTRYMKPKHTPGSLKDGVIEDNLSVVYMFDTIEIMDVEHLVITDNDVKFVINEIEE